MSLRGCAIALALVAALLASSIAAVVALDFPALTGRIVDEANILNATTRAELNSKLEALEKKTSDQLVVVTLKSLQGTSIEDFGYQLGRHWRIGQKGKDNGVVLIVAPNERRVRIEVGYGLEGTLPDAVSKLIIENSITPRFRADDFPGGIVRGVDDIISILTGDAEEWKRRAVQQQARRDSNSVETFFMLLFILVIVLIVLASAYNSLAGLGPRRRRGRDGGWYWPTGTSSGGDWSGSSSGGSSGDSGGFSGGGGSFGGGGASGSW